MLSIVYVHINYGNLIINENIAHGPPNIDSNRSTAASTFPFVYCNTEALVSSLQNPISFSYWISEAYFCFKSAWLRAGAAGAACGAAAGAPNPAAPGNGKPPPIPPPPCINCCIIYWKPGWLIIFCIAPNGFCGAPAGYAPEAPAGAALGDGAGAALALELDVWEPGP